MSLTTNTPYNSRLLLDANYIAATSSANTIFNSFNLVQAVPYPTTEVVILNVSTPSLSGSNTTASFLVQDSADNTTFAAVAALSPQNINAVSGSAASVSWLLPPTVRQYVRVTGSVSGTVSGAVTASLEF